MNLSHTSCLELVWYSTLCNVRVPPWVILSHQNEGSAEFEPFFWLGSALVQNTFAEPPFHSAQSRRSQVTEITFISQDNSLDYFWRIKNARESSRVIRRWLLSSCDPRHSLYFFRIMYKYKALPPPNHHHFYLPITLNWEWAWIYMSD